MRVGMGLTASWHMAKILTDNWQIAENLTDNWLLWWAFYICHISVIDRRYPARSSNLRDGRHCWYFKSCCKQLLNWFGNGIERHRSHITSNDANTALALKKHLISFLGLMSTYTLAYKPIFWIFATYGVSQQPRKNAVSVNITFRTSFLSFSCT